MVRISAARSAEPGEYTIFICGLSNPTPNDYLLVAQLAPPLRLKIVDRPR